jgi:hypothetical protein
MGWKYLGIAATLGCTACDADHLSASIDLDGDGRPDTVKVNVRRGEEIFWMSASTQQKPIVISAGLAVPKCNKLVALEPKPAPPLPPGEPAPANLTQPAIMCRWGHGVDTVSQFYAWNGAALELEGTVVQ